MHQTTGGTTITSPGDRAMEQERKRRKPNAQQQRFVEAYLIHLDAGKAAEEAGYSRKNRHSVGYQLMQNPVVREAIEEAKGERTRRTAVDADAVLLELVSMATADPEDLLDEHGAVRPLAEIPVGLRKMIASLDVEERWESVGKERVMVGFVKKIRLWPKERALDLLAKHLGLVSDLTKNLNVDLGRCTEEQLARIAAGEDPVAVLADSAEGRGGRKDPPGAAMTRDEREAAGR